MLSVSTKDRARTDTRQIVTQDDIKSKLPLGGGYTETNLCCIPEERKEMKKVFSFFLCVLHPPLKHFQLFTWNSAYIAVLMGFQ